ncbi:nucleotidyl transferase AbiEii/AbiGii toxin family protein [Algoriphagus mannitolivorans]|uniref:nucleotidyl transferase AbiEii/AbiGii toxin family protein n=1 Tax=Algoriphagus mannitolivorans TaxID=226504 RepID=UPI0003F53DFD|nr:nucleotidyl transferase AbiEii/AbiGii toxin family protein [Algoriphagus mannitolivorans]
MLKNTRINRLVTKKIALALGELNEQVVYVGGAVVSLYVDDPAADDVRPTKDLDLTMKIASLSELENIRQLLEEKGFVQSAMDSVVCRFRYEDILVDVMATVPIGWAPGNRWFEQGLDQAISKELEEIAIRILPLPYFLATKFDAFFDRGVKDVFASHDFEDIVYLFNHVTDISEQILYSDKVVRQYLGECAAQILENRTFQEAIIGNLFYEHQEERFKLIIDKLSTVAHGI